MAVGLSATEMLMLMRQKNVNKDAPVNDIYDNPALVE